LHEEFSFTVDCCADESNHKLQRYWSKKEDGLSKNWDGERVWCNPPFGRHIGVWTKKALESHCITVMLVPAKTETDWWCDHVLNATEIRFIRKRLNYKGGGRPFFASVVVVFRGQSMTTPLVSVLDQSMAIDAVHRAGLIPKETP